MPEEDDDDADEEEPPVILVDELKPIPLNCPNIEKCMILMHLLFL